MFSFTKRKKTVDVNTHMRRLCDLTTPNLTAKTEGRCENRYNRSIPTLIGPWQDDHPSVDECIIGLTSDISDRGVSLILSQPFRADAVVVGYWITSDEICEPWFFLGNIRRNQAIGGGFWTVGIELVEFANPNYTDPLAALNPLASQLCAPDPVTV